MIVLDKNISLINPNTSHLIQKNNEKNIEQYINKRQKYFSIFEQANQDYKEIINNYKIIANSALLSSNDADFNISNSLTHQFLMKIICKGNLLLTSCSANVVKEMNISFQNQNLKIGLFRNNQHKLVIFKYEGTDTGKENPNFLGEGNYGLVQKISDLSKGQLFALKTSKTSAPKDLNSIKNEVRMLCSIEKSSIGLQKGDSNVLKFNQNILGYITKLYNRGSLKDAVEIVNNLSNKKKLNLIISLYSGLHYLEKKKIIHGDIKPQNCYVNQIGKKIEVVLGDLGGAINQNKKTKHYIGTPYSHGYFTFKDLKNLKKTHLNNSEAWVDLGQKRDLFALTKTVWFLLTQASPFENKEVKFENSQYRIADTSKILNDITVKETIGSNAANILIQCFNEDSYQRPSLEEVIQILKQARSNLSFSNSPCTKDTAMEESGTFPLESMDETTIELSSDS